MGLDMQGPILRLWLMFIAVLTVAPAIASAQAQVKVERDHHRLSIDARSSSVAEILAALKQQIGIEYHCPGALCQREVKALHLSGQSLYAVFQQLLKGYNVAVVSDHGVVQSVHILGEGKETSISGLASNQSVSFPVDGKAAKKAELRRLIDERVRTRLADQGLTKEEIDAHLAEMHKPKSERQAREKMKKDRDPEQEQTRLREKDRRFSMKLEQLHQLQMQLEAEGKSTARVREKIAKLEAKRKQLGVSVKTAP